MAAMRPSRLMLTLCAALAHLATPAGVAAFPGDLDTTWGGGGIVRRELAANASAWTLTEQPDGAVLVGVRELAPAPRVFRIARHAADGALDPTFGTGGEVITSFPGEDAHLEAVLVQPDGKIVAVGTTIGSGLAVAMVRYLPSGALDPSFGTGGVVQELAAYSPQVFDAALAPDGDILVGSTASLGGTGTDFGVARFNPDGSLDTAFGTGGLTSANVSAAPTPNDFGTALLPQFDGRIVVAGYYIGATSNDVAVARFTTAGALDPSFGTSGIARIPVAGTHEAIAAAALQVVDGKIVLAGHRQLSPTDFDQLVLRLAANGALDVGFGASGEIETDFGGFDAADGVAIQPSGEIVVAGGGGVAPDTTLVRYTANGALDPGFGVGGIVTTAHAGGPSGVTSFLRAADASLLVGGLVADAGDPPNDLVVTRYLDRPHATRVPAAYGTWAFDTSGNGTITFSTIETSVFGSTVDLGTTVGALTYVPSSLVSTGNGFTTSGTASGPNLTMALDGLAEVRGGALNWPTSFVAGAVGGSALPAGPEYVFIGSLSPSGLLLSGGFTLHALLPANTPTGTDVGVTASGISITFANVTSAGDTGVTPRPMLPAVLPAKFVAVATVNGQLSVGGVDIHTTASFTGPVTLCFGYPVGAVDPAQIRLLHFVGGQYVLVPLTIDPTNARVCGEVFSFSPFVVALEGPDAQGALPSTGERPCATKQHKLAAKLGRAVFKCRDKRMRAALAGTPFSEPECLATARTKHERATAGLSGCAPCTAGNLDDIRDLLVGELLSLSAGVFCDGTTSLAADDLARVPPDTTVAKCESKLGALTNTLFGAYVQCLVKSATTATPDTDCEASARAKFEARATLLSGCTCPANAAVLVNRLERLVDRELNPLVYCAGGVPFP